MIRAGLSVTSILNAVSPRLRRVPVGAVAVLLLTALPVRFFQMHFISLLHRLGNEAPYYGNLLMAVAAFMTVSFLVSLYGRMVFMAAIQTTPRTWRDLLRVDVKRFLAYIYVALTIEIALVLFWPTLIAIPLAIMLAGVAAAVTTDPPRIGLLAPLRALSPYLGHGGVLGGLMFVFAAGFGIAVVNYALLLRIVDWLLGAVPAFDTIPWQAALQQSSRMPLAVVAIAATTVEPFFLTAMHVYAERVRARSSGDDLLHRFRDVTAAKPLAAAFMILFGALTLRAQTAMTTAEYIGRLTAVHEAFRGSHFSEAQRIVADLESVVTVQAVENTYEPDRPLLQAIALACGHEKYDLVLDQRLQSTIDALRQSAAFAHMSVNRRLLDEIRARERVGELARGGTLRTLPQTDPTFGDEVARIFRRTIEWLAARLEKLFDWLGRLWPRQHDRDDDMDRFLGVPVVVWVITSMIVACVLLLGLYVVRRSKTRPAFVASAAITASSRDADPLSREANEWETYARELAAAGRLREAIRAWYHAVLMTLYRSGLLHYRKGATNWEYVTALAPRYEWRPHFVDMTRNFDLEWYGRRDTRPEALEACAADALLILNALREEGR